MNRSAFIAAMIVMSGATLALNASMAYGQDFPSKPLRIVTGTAGGGSDFIARQIAQGISGPLGQPVIVVNFGQNRQTDLLAQSQPDGYTICLGGNGIWTEPLFRKMSYDVVRDFAPLTLVSRDVNVIAVNAAVPANSVKELIALAKAKPGVMNYASSSLGSPQHLGTEIFKSMAGIDVVGVPYKGVAQALTGMVSGEAQMIIGDRRLIEPLVKSGKLRALAVTSITPTALAPGLPTVSATGVPGYQWIGMSGMFVPIKTPANIIARLNQEIVRFLNRPEIKERFLANGVEVVASSPAEFDAAMKSDINAVAKVVKDAGLKVE